MGDGGTFVVLRNIVLTLLVFGVLIWIFLPSTVPVKKNIMCSEETGEFVCADFSEGCDAIDGYDSYELGILGCIGTGNVCCKKSNSGGGNNQVDPNKATFRAPTLSVSKLTGEELFTGQPVFFIPEKKEEFVIRGTVDRGDENQQWKVEITAEDSFGQDAEKWINPDFSEIENNIQESIDEPDKESFSADLGIIEINPQFSGEQVTLTITIFPVDDEATDLKASIKKYDPGLIKIHKMYFTVASALRYAGLTQQWDQSKTVTAGCEYVNCKEVLFKVIDVKDSRPATPNGPAKESELCKVQFVGSPADAEGKIEVPDGLNGVKFIDDDVRYCVFKNHQWSNCEETVAQCIAGRDGTGDSEYSAALDAMLSQLTQGQSTEEQVVATTLSMFAQSQSKQTAYCVPRGGYADVLYRTSSFDLSSQRGSFELASPDFGGKHLCVYGLGHDGQLYSAGQPQPIKIDLVAPEVTVDFKPLSLKLIFDCVDRGIGGSTSATSVSGCKDGYGLAYVNNVASFIQALVNKNNMNSIAWCPSYVTGSGYFTEYRDEMIYTDPALKVLCVRAEDNAGNVGIAMVTVYNGYDVFFAALSEALA